MLQDIAPKKLDNQYKPSAEPTDESVVFVFKDRNVLVRQDEGKLFQRLALLEEEKTLPFGAVYDYFNLKNNIPVGEEYIADIEKYEAEVLAKRN